MLNWEYDEEAVNNIKAQENYDRGIAVGKTEGKVEGIAVGKAEGVEVLAKLIKKGIPLDEAIKTALSTPPPAQ